MPPQSDTAFAKLAMLEANATKPASLKALTMVVGTHQRTNPTKLPRPTSWRERPPCPPHRCMWTSGWLGPWKCFDVIVAMRPVSLKQTTSGETRTELAEHLLPQRIGLKWIEPNWSSKIVQAAQACKASSGFTRSGHRHLVPLIIKRLSQQKHLPSDSRVRPEFVD